MFESVFGTEMPLSAKFVLAFAIVLALIALTAWLVRRFAANSIGGAAARGRQPRLAVIDAAPVDARRRLVLIRRDNVEHLLMIGGPSDVVVEQNIVRAVGQTRDARQAESASSWTGASDSPSSMPTLSPPAGRFARPADEETWPTPPALDVAPAREPFVAREPDFSPAPEPKIDTLREPPPMRPTPPRETFAPREPLFPPRDTPARAPAADGPNFGGDIPPRPAPSPTPRPAPAVQPALRRDPEPAAPKPKAPRDEAADQNLAEMASRLEAALRRPPQPTNRPPVTDALVMAPKNIRPRPPESSTQEPRRPAPVAAAPVTAPDIAPSAAPEPQLPEETKPAGKSVYESLEQEMASLLGRPATRK